MPPPTMTTLASLGRLEFTMGREFTCETFFHNAPFRGQRVRGATWHYHPIESGLQDFRRPLTLSLSPSDGERVAFRPGEGNTCVTSAGWWCRVAPTGPVERCSV